MRSCCWSTRGDSVVKVNGHEVYAKSRWTTFDRRDISDQMVVGENIIEVTVTATERRVRPQCRSENYNGSAGGVAEGHAVERFHTALPDE